MKDVVSLSQQIGARIPFWTQGAGGNISQKKDGKLWIKASGMRLENVTETNGLACVELAILQSQIPNLKLDADCEQKYAELLRTNAAPQFGRPSMESGFHALLKSTYVVHFHSLASLLMAHEHFSNPTKFASWLKKNSSTIRCYVIENVLPGLELCYAASAREDNNAVLVQNHGVILHADDLNVLRQWEKFENQFLSDWNYELSYEINKPTPFKLYFPDTVVFAERILKILKPVSDNIFVAKDEASLKDKDAFEIWQAISCLYHACPALAEIPESMASRIANLPTEQFRRTLKR